MRSTKVCLWCWLLSPMGAAAAALVVANMVGNTISRTCAQEARDVAPQEPASVVVQVEEARSQEGQQEEARPEEPDRQPRPETARRLVEELQQRIRGLRQRIAEARQQGEATEELQAALEEAQGRLREIMQNVRPAVQEARQRLRARWEELQAALRRAREANQPEQVQQLEQQLDELQREMRRLEAERPSGVEGDARAERMAHLRQAIEHLRAAGLPDQAEHLMRLMPRLMEEGAAPVGPPPARPFGPPEGFPEGRGPVFPPTGQFPMIIRELQEQIHQLRQEVAELRQLVRERAVPDRRGERRQDHPEGEAPELRPPQP